MKNPALLGCLGSALFCLCCVSGARAHGGHGIEEVRAGRVLAANCAACHGTDGKAQDAMPVLAGKPKQYIVEQMQAFKTGKRPATIMHQIAKGYTDRQIAQMADYFADQK
ncbi:MAG: c-type cytochrome [Burkholderiales bacterium]|nr:c-type cytochrome [Burkholderiales bacterium]